MRVGAWVVQANLLQRRVEFGQLNCSASIQIQSAECFRDQAVPALHFDHRSHELQPLLVLFPLLSSAVLQT